MLNIEMVEVPSKANFRTSDYAVCVDGQEIYRSGEKSEARFILIATQLHHKN